jgi:signal transduction histidine kinase/AraC-like DNA-binding protein
MNVTASKAMAHFLSTSQYNQKMKTTNFSSTLLEDICERMGIEWESERFGTNGRKYHEKLQKHLSLNDFLTGQKPLCHPQQQPSIPCQVCCLPLMLPMLNQSWLAVIFLVLLALLAVMSYLLYRNHLASQEAKAYEQRQRESERRKARFLEGITQDIRTAVTELEGHVEHSFRQAEVLTKDDLLFRTQSIRCIGRRVLQLIEQSLDIRKLELGLMELKPESGDIVNFLRLATANFDAWAAKKNIQLSYRSEMGQLVMDFDREKVGKILLHLLANAMQATPEHGRVCVCIEHKHGQLIIKVKDTGDGIPRKQLNHVFDIPKVKHRFSDDMLVSAGLFLVRELSALHGGDATVKSITNVGSVYSVRLPAPFNDHDTIKQFQHLEDKYIQHATPDFGDWSNRFTPSVRPTLLMLGDNNELSKKLIAAFEMEYSLLFAHEGKVAPKLAAELFPDLIITNLGMANLEEGLEQLDLLRSDTRTSHLPIILVCDKQGIERELDHIKHLACTYIEKPFQDTELIYLVEKNLNQYHQPHESQRITKINGQSADNFPNEFDLHNGDAFYHKVLKIIDTHIGDANLNVEQLCRELNISYSQLQRRIARATDKSPNQLIRGIRLHKALILLHNPEINISEIATMTGFNDPSYFTRIFTKEFGMPPSEYRDKNMDEIIRA